MAFQASAPPLPSYQPISDKLKPGGEEPSTSELFEAGFGHPGPHGYVVPPPYQPLQNSNPCGHDHPHYHHPHPGLPIPYPSVNAPVVFGFPVGPPASPPHWKTGLCGCCSDPAICLLGCCCPCILLGKIAEDLDDGATSCIVACIVWYLLQQFTGCGWIYSCGYRDKLRARYGLARNLGRDCIVHFCCWHCAFCQEYREIRIRRLREEAAWGRHAAMAPPPPQVMQF